MIEELKRAFRISDPPDRWIGAGRRAQPCDDEIVKAPSLDRNLALLSLKNRDAKLLYGKTVTDRRNHAEPARTGLRRNGRLRGCLGLGRRFLCHGFGGCRYRRAACRWRRLGPSNCRET